MGLDPSVAGAENGPYELAYDWKTLVLYALGIGAKRDELDYLYEGRGPKAYPTIAVLPAYAPLMALLPLCKGNLSTMVHGGQAIRVHRPIPPSGVFSTTGRIDGVYDMKRLGQVVCTTKTEVAGHPVFETEWSLLFRGEGGFGGRPPARDRGPKVADDASPLFSSEETTLPEQALLYRLSGDTNPLHADPEFAKSVGFDGGPILHGLATLGFVARALIRHACHGDGNRLRYMSAQFRKPVWPGETIRTVGYAVDGKIALRAYAGGRPEAVITDSYAEID